jgi:hypothetical protein
MEMNMRQSDVKAEMQPFRDAVLFINVEENQNQNLNKLTHLRQILFRKWRRDRPLKCCRLDSSGQMPMPNESNEQEIIDIIKGIKFYSS